MTRTLIDGHLHSWERAHHPQPWVDPETMPQLDRDFPLVDAERLLAGAGMLGAVAVQTLNSAKETLDLLTGAASSSAVLGVVGWVDLTGDIPAQLDTLRSAPGGRKLVGTRHLAHLEPDPGWLLQPAVSAGVRATADAGLAVDLVIYAPQLPVATELVDRHPETRFVLDHLAKPPLRAGGTELERWAQELADFARRENVVAKVSGLTMEADWGNWTPRALSPAVETALTAFGPERLMFGSDWPLVELAGGHAAWHEAYCELTAKLSPSEQANLDRATARRVYGLPDE